MKRLIILLAAAAAFSSCIINAVGAPIIGNGVPAEKTVAITEFETISVAGAADVVFIQDITKTEVILKTDENLLDVYKIAVEDGTLVISPERGKSPIPKKGTSITIYSPSVDGINISGSCDFSIPGTVILTDSFKYKVSGSGDLDINILVCKDFTAAVSGSGDIDITSLTAASTDLSISGSGNIDLGCNGAGDISVRIAGSGDVKLHGLARSLSQKVAGSGNIETSGLILTGN